MHCSLGPLDENRKISFLAMVLFTSIIVTLIGMSFSQSASTIIAAITDQSAVTEPHLTTPDI